ncbi:MAG: ATP-binding protein [Archangium sp.]|nr:ATP-binding protein [Archangium sp.]
MKKVARVRARPRNGAMEHLRSQLAESRAAFAALASGQVDSITDATGPVLLKLAQEALRRSAENFRTLIEQLPDQVWVHRGGHLVYVNEEVVRALGYEREELVGRGLIEFVLPEDRPSMEARLRKPIPNGQRAAQYEARLSHRNGSVVVIEVTPQGLHFDGAHATLEAAHDITERKRLEDRLHVANRMATIGMLAAGVAHEINNPLSFVIANLGFVGEELGNLRAKWPEDDGSFDESAVALKDALEGTERVKTIVRDLKLFSRSEDGARGPVDVQRMLDMTGKLAWNEVRHRARLVKDYSAARLIVEGNESHLSQVFLNLIVNAAHAIKEGAAEQNEIRLSASTDGAGRVVIEVRDSGAGMSAEVQRQLFTPFFTTKPRGEGTGLGLSICQKIVSSHGGEIHVVSELGVGTTFRVSLRPYAQPVIAMAEPVAPKRAGPRGRVLVIDDEAMLGNTLRRVLKAHHDVELETSGRSALQRLSADRDFDVIFCDLMMPDLAGPAVFELIAGQHPELADRVVFLTGGAFSDAAQAFLARTPNLKIDKPFTRDQILEVVSRFVTSARASTGSPRSI